MTMDVISAVSIAEASAAMTDSARYFAGGTLLMREVNYGNCDFDRLVVSDDTELRNIHVNGDQITIGAGVTMTMMLRHPDLAFLADAARSVGGPAIRNMATIGGNLFAPRPYGDLASALLALDATVHWASGQEHSIDQFFELPRTATDIVTSISVRRPMSGGFRYMKVSRVKPKGVSVLTIAALLNRQNGRVGNVRLAFGGMAPQPVRAKAAEQALQGASLDEAGIQNCIAATNEGLTPMDDALASAWYRLEVAPVYLRRLLLQRGDY